MMKWRLAIAVATAMVAAAMMPTLKAAEETPMITVYEANVTDMDGYKNQFLTALQPKIDKAQERWLARGGKTTLLIGKAPENRVVMSMFSSKAKLDDFGAEAKDDFKIGQKYSTGMRFFAMPAITPPPTISGTPTLRSLRSQRHRHGELQERVPESAPAEDGEAQASISCAWLQCRRSADR